MHNFLLISLYYIYVLLSLLDSFAFKPSSTGKFVHFHTQEISCETTSSHFNIIYVLIYFIVDYGGIYLDHDVVVVKSFDTLRKYDFTMGREISFSLNNGIMIGREGAPFAQIWLETYRSTSMNLTRFGYESVRMAHNLSVLFPHLLHVE